MDVGTAQGAVVAPPREKLSSRRRDQVVVAAIQVLAQYGARGLTHRQVDRHLEWPLGSTSNYYRRRSDLFVAITERIMQLDLADLAILDDDFGHGGVTTAVVTERIVALMQKWAKPSRRSRTMARAEILFESSRNAEVRDATQTQMAVAQARFMRIFRELGAIDPRASAEFFAILMTGMSVGMCLTGDTPAGHELQRLVATWIDLAVRKVSAGDLPSAARPVPHVAQP